LCTVWVAAALRDVESRLGRSVNPTVYTAVEFARKLKARANFLKNVRVGKKLFMIGNEHELASAPDERPNQTPHNNP
jgi:hypothetical protein